MYNPDGALKILECKILLLAGWCEVINCSCLLINILKPIIGEDHWLEQHNQGNIVVNCIFKALSSMVGSVQPQLAFHTRWET